MVEFECPVCRDRLHDALGAVRHQLLTHHHGVWTPIFPNSDGENVPQIA